MSMETGKKRLNFGFIGLAIAAIGLVIVLVVFLIRRAKEKKKLQPITKQTEQGETIDESSRPTIEQQKQMFRDIMQNAMQFGFGKEAAKAIAAQSAHETGRWSSELFARFNNLFGMKSGGAGANIQTGENSGFATYDDFNGSLLDYCEWCKKNNYPFNDDLNIEQHCQWLKTKKYYEDSFVNYKRSVLSLANELGG